jgi:hypothetical protein
MDLFVFSITFEIISSIWSMTFNKSFFNQTKNRNWRLTECEMLPWKRLDKYELANQSYLFWWFKKILKCFFVHLDQRSMWTIAITLRLSSVVCRLLSVVCCLSSVNFSHFKAFSPKPLGQLQPNLARMFLGWSSTKLLFFVLVGYSTWLPGSIICSDWLKFQRSSSLKLMNWLNPNCKWMIIGMSFTKFLFFMSIGNPRWPSSQDTD